jgi:malonyl CoA-acyl carrier protein transacylase
MSAAYSKTDEVYGGYDVVVTGFSGRLPTGQSVHEWSKYLYEKPEVMLSDYSYAGYGYSNGSYYKRAEFESSDPTFESLFKTTLEAFDDAGLTTAEFKGSNTGVFIGKSGGSFDGDNKHIYVGQLTSYFDFHGPSEIFETYEHKPQVFVAFDFAVSAIKHGLCDRAVVVGINFYGTEKYGNVDGVIIVEKKPFNDTKKYYGKVLKSSVERLPTTTTPFAFDKFMAKAYADHGRVDPSAVNYLETSWWSDSDMPSNNVQPYRLIADSFAKFYSKSSAPFYVGSSKWNYGHYETPTYSLIKMFVGMKSGMAPANGFYKFDDQLPHKAYKINDTNTKISGLWALSYYGSVYAHFVFEPYAFDFQAYPTSAPPKFYTMTGPSEKFLHEWFDAQANGVYQAPYPSTSTSYRGFAVVQDDHKKFYEIKKFNTIEKKAVWYIFTGITSASTTFAQLAPSKLKEMLRIEPFRASFFKSFAYMKPYGLDLAFWKYPMDGKYPDNALFKYVFMPAVQIAFVDTLKALGIEPDYIVGHSCGELVAAYVDGALSHEQVLFAAYYKAKLVVEKYQPSSTSSFPMALVGLAYDTLVKYHMPASLAVVYYNTKDLVTITGPKREFDMFVQELIMKGVYVKQIDGYAADVPPFNTHYMTKYVAEYQAELDKIIATPKPRSWKWVSTSVPESQLYDNTSYSIGKYASGEYFANNLTSPVHFYDAVKRMPEDAIAIEFSPFEFLKAFLPTKPCETPSASYYYNYVNLMMTGDANSKSPLYSFLIDLGRLYNEGINFDWKYLWKPSPMATENSNNMPIGYKKFESLPSYYEHFGPFESKTTTTTDSAKYPFNFEPIDNPATKQMAYNKQYSFMPYNQQFDVNDVYYAQDQAYKYFYDNFDKYMHDVKYFVDKIVGNLVHDKRMAYDNKAPKLTGYKYKSTFLELLGKLDGCVEVPSVYAAKVKSFFDDLSVYKAWIEDPYLSYMSDVYYKSIFDTVYENSPVYDGGKKLKVLEISSSFNWYGTKISKLLGTYASAHVEYYYVPIDNFNKIVWTEWKKDVAYPCNLIDWKYTTEDFPYAKYKDFDLVIFNGSIGALPFFDDKNLVKKWLHSFSEKALAPQGFVFLQEYAHNDDYKYIVNSLKQLEQYNFDKQTKPIDTTYKPYTTADEWKALFADPYYYPVSYKSDAKLATFQLYRKSYNKMAKTDSLDLNISAHDDVPSLFAKVKYALGKYNRVWLIGGYHLTPVDIYGLMQKLVVDEPKAYNVVRWIVRDDDETDPNYYVANIKLGDLFMNVYKQGKWGTYVPHGGDYYNNNKYVYESSRPCSFVDYKKHGDYTTAYWTQMPEPTVNDSTTEKLIAISYTSLHSYSPDNETPAKTLSVGPYVGMEFSGFDGQKRYMGIKPVKSFTTSIVCDSKYLWEVPNDWTMEQAATVPYSYATAFYAMFVRGNLKRGESVWIYDGASLFGQAAIAIALYHACKVFVSVETSVERDYLKALYPTLGDEYFGYFGDYYFDKKIMAMTNDKGVSLTLSSKPLKPNSSPSYGHVVYVVGANYPSWTSEANYNSGPSGFTKYQIDIGKLFEHYESSSSSSPSNDIEWQRVYKYIDEGIKYGYVKPLGSVVYDQYKLQDAFAYMNTTKKPLKKVLIKLADVDEWNWSKPKTIGRKVTMSDYTTSTPPIAAKIPDNMFFVASNKFSFSPYYAYVLVNGVDSPFGWYLAYWMAKKGARKFLFTTTNSKPTTIANDYQYKKALSYLETEYKAIVHVLYEYDAKYDEQCVGMLNEAKGLSEERIVGGVFYMYSQTDAEALYGLESVDKMKTWIDKAYYGAYNLDKYTRNMQTNNGYFVVFSPFYPTSADLSYQFYEYTHFALERLFKSYRYDDKYAYYFQSPTYTGLDKPLFDAEYKFDDYFDHLEWFFINKIRYPSVAVRYTQPQFYQTPYKLPMAKTFYQPPSVSHSPSYSTYELSEVFNQATSFLMPKKTFEKLNQIETTYYPPVFIVHPIEGHVNMLKQLAQFIKYPVYGIQFTVDALKYDSIEALADYYWQQINKEFPHYARIHLCGYRFGACVAFEMAAKRSDTVASLTFLDGTYKYTHKFFDLQSPEADAQLLYQFVSQYGHMANPTQFIMSLIDKASRVERIKYAVTELFAYPKFNFDFYDIEWAATAYIAKMTMAYKYEPKFLYKVPEVLVCSPYSEQNEADAYERFYNGKFLYKTFNCDKRELMDATYGFEVAKVLNEFWMKWTK